jgi:hypothetical protein
VRQTKENSIVVDQSLFERWIRFQCISQFWSVAGGNGRKYPGTDCAKSDFLILLLSSIDLVGRTSGAFDNHPEICSKLPHPKCQWRLEKVDGRFLSC